MPNYLIHYNNHMVQSSKIPYHKAWIHSQCQLYHMYMPHILNPLTNQNHRFHPCILHTSTPVYWAYIHTDQCLCYIFQEVWTLLHYNYKGDNHLQKPRNHQHIGHTAYQLCSVYICIVQNLGHKIGW